MTHVVIWCNTNTSTLNYWQWCILVTNIIKKSLTKTEIEIERYKWVFTAEELVI